MNKKDGASLKNDKDQDDWRKGELPSPIVATIPSACVWMGFVARAILDQTVGIQVDKKNFQ